MRERRLVGVLLVLARDADELLQVLEPPLRLDRSLRLERLDVAAALERALDELRDGELERARLQRLHHVAEARNRLLRRCADARLLGELRRLPERAALRVGPRLQPREARVADPAAGAVRDPHERDRVVWVVDRLQVRDGVLDLGALVEARPADHLVRDALPNEHVLQHARLRVRPVEDADLVAGKALLDQTRNAGRDEPRLRVLVLDLDDVHRLAVAEVGPELLRLALAVVRDHVVGSVQDVVRRAVVLLERDRASAGEVALEVKDVVDVSGPERIDRLVRVANSTNVVLRR